MLKRCFCLLVVAVFAFGVLAGLASGATHTLFILGGGASAVGSDVSVGNTNKLVKVILSKQGSYTPHAPIRINSDSDFDIQFPNRTISGYEIICTGFENCIYIGNCTKSFTIRECYLHNSNDSGIYIYNCLNGILLNNTINYTFYGILIESSGNITISNNTISLNYCNGIYIRYSDENTIINNRLFSNNDDGICIEFSHNNKIINNNISSNSIGIDLYRAKNVIITNNTMSNNGIALDGNSRDEWYTHTITMSNTVNGNPVYYWKDKNGVTVPSNAGQVILVNCTNVIVMNQNIINASVGIELGYSSYCIVRNNEIALNCRCGIYLVFSNNNTVVFNNISLSYNDISLLSSTNNKITNNSIVSSNRDGIWLGYSDYNVISYNRINNNTNSTSQTMWLDGGIYLYYSNNNVITDNNFSLNVENGICLEVSNSNKIANNKIFSSRVEGIRLLWSQNNTIDNNTIASNGYDGIHFHTAYNNTIAHNLISKNGGYGIYIALLHTPGSNAIINNIIISNGGCGINFINGFNSNIINNNISLNVYAGIELTTSHNNTISNNTMFSNHGFGICLERSSHNIIFLNNFTLNKNYSIYVITDYSCFDRIYYNNFVNNNLGGIQASDDAGQNFWNTSTEGNYWSDWTSPDNNSDGIVDFPYILDGSAGAKDYYPLAAPVQIPEFSPAPFVIISVLLFSLAANACRRRGE